MKIGQQVHFSARITRVIDSSSYPDWLELRFTDAHGKEWVLEEKAPVVTCEDVVPREPYKEDASIAAMVVDKQIAGDGRSIVVVNTDKPWGISDVGGNTHFDLLADNLILDP